MARLTADEFAAWVAASCVRHGVPVKLADAGATAQVVVLLQGRVSRPDATRRAAARLTSEAPDDVDTVGVKGASTGSTGTDHDPVDNGAHDRDLSSQG